MRLQIRQFEQADQVAARALILAGLAARWGVLDPAYNRDLDDIFATYCQAGALFYVGEVAGALVATCALTFDGPGIGRIERMSVREDFQGQGFGRTLTLHLIEVARQHDCHIIKLETTSTWTSAINLYISCGFVPQFEQAGDTHMQRLL